MTIEAGLILSRFLHYTCVLAIFGLSLFPLYTKADRPFPSHEFRRWRQKALLISTGVGIVSAIAWFVFTAAVMADGFLAALDMSTLESVIEDTSFGKVWVLRVSLLLCLFALLAFARRPRKQRLRLHIALASVIAGSLAAVGHTRTHEGPLRAIHALSDSLHLLAAGAWLGGFSRLGLLSMRRVKIRAGAKKAILGGHSSDFQAWAPLRVGFCLPRVWRTPYCLRALFQD